MPLNVQLKSGATLPIPPEIEAQGGAAIDAFVQEQEGPTAEAEVAPAPTSRRAGRAALANPEE